MPRERRDEERAVDRLQRVEPCASGPVIARIQRDLQLGLEHLAVLQWIVTAGVARSQLRHELLGPCRVAESCFRDRALDVDDQVHVRIVDILGRRVTMRSRAHLVGARMIAGPVVCTREYAEPASSGLPKRKRHPPHGMQGRTPIITSERALVSSVPHRTPGAHIRDLAAVGGSTPARSLPTSGNARCVNLTAVVLASARRP